MVAQVHRLELASVTQQGKYNPPSFKDARIPFCAYLIVANSEIVLVDTGVGEGNRYIDRTFLPERTPLPEALAPFGLSPGDVTILVNSHLHFDHCGNNAQFAHAPVFVQEAELAAAREPNYTVRECFDFEGAQLHPVRGDLLIHADIQLLSTPGHTPGHQSVLVTTGAGPTLIAAQAAYNRSEFARGGNSDVQAHEGFGAAYEASLERLQGIEATDVLLSHDHALDEG